ncbi:MAG: hypothetical protein OHK0039_06750 [Bacteroidia bacterium]
MFAANHEPALSRERLHRQVYASLLVVLAASLPLSRAGVSTSIGLLLLNSLVAGQFRNRWRRLRVQAWVWPLLGFFGLYLAGLLYSDHVPTGLQNLRVKLPLLLLPLVVGSERPLDRRELRFVIEGFVGACLLAIVLALGTAAWQGLARGDFQYADFAYTTLSGHVDLHPNYFGLILNLVAVLLWQEALRPDLRPVRRRLLFVLLTLLLLMQVLLAARTQMLLFLVVMGWGLYRYAGGGWPRWLRLALAGGLPVLAVGLALLLPASRARFADMVQGWAAYPIHQVHFSGTAVRVYIWDAALEQLRKTPFLGYGTGDELAVLQEVYREDGFLRPTMNAHNQYLQSALALGLVGVVCLLLVFVPLIRLAWQHRNGLLAFVLLLFAVSCLTEAMLERQLELTFFAFFSAILAMNRGRLPIFAELPGPLPCAAAIPKDLPQ